MQKFKNREDAAKQLLETLPIEQIRNERWSLLAVSPGGLEIASYLNNRLKVSIEMLFSAAIYAPHNAECEIARVCETEEIVIHDALCKAFDIQLDYVYGEAKRKYEERILQQMYRYRKGRPFEPKEGKAVLLIDEGSECGLKLMTAIKAVLAQQPKAVYVAVPVLPTEVLEAIEPLVDNIFFVHELENYKETWCYYELFDDVLDPKIIEILHKDLR
jgi:putative phosphoribosyl transferase